jgi:hypothetical protein
MAGRAGRWAVLWVVLALACGPSVKRAADVGASSAEAAGAGGSGTAGVQGEGGREVSGTVQVISGSGITIEDRNGRWHRLRLSDGTEIRAGEVGASVLELPEGTHVRARYSITSGEKIAGRVEIVPPDR